MFLKDELVYPVSILSLLTGWEWKRRYLRITETTAKPSDNPYPMENIANDGD